MQPLTPEVVAQRLTEYRARLAAQEAIEEQFRAQRQALSDHFAPMIHTAQKPYVCDICGGDIKVGERYRLRSAIASNANHNAFFVQEKACEKCTNQPVPRCLNPGMRE